METEVDSETTAARRRLQTSWITFAILVVAILWTGLALRRLNQLEPTAVQFRSDALATVNALIAADSFAQSGRPASDAADEMGAAQLAWQHLQRKYAATPLASHPSMRHMQEAADALAAARRIELRLARSPSASVALQTKLQERLQFAFVALDEARRALEGSFDSRSR